MEYDDYPLLTPRRRRALIWLAVLVPLLIVGIVVLHLHSLERLEAARRELRQQGPLDPLAYAPAVAPEPHNAALAFFAAAQEIDTTRQDRITLRRARHRRPPAWSATEWAATHRQLATNRDVRAALRRASTLPGAGLGLDYTRLDPSSRSAPLLSLASAGRLLELESHAAVAGGDLEAAAAAVETLGRLATVVHLEPDPLLQVLAVAIGGNQLRAVREIVAAGPAPTLVPRLEAALAGTADRTAYARALHREAAHLLAEDPGRRARAVGRRAGPLWHGLSWIAGELLLVEGLGPRLALARVDELGYRQLLAASEAATSRLPLGPFGSLSVELRSATLRVSAAAASRQLAELALALTAQGLRDGHYPADLASSSAARTPDPLTGSLPTYRHSADGSARLELTAAEAKAGSANGLDSLPFVWELPPPRR